MSLKPVLISAPQRCTMGSPHTSRGLVLVLGCIVIAVSVTFAAAAAPHRFRPVGTSRSVRDSVRQDLLSQCREIWRNATLDHFTFVSAQSGLGGGHQAMQAIWAVTGSFEPCTDKGMRWGE